MRAARNFSWGPEGSDDPTDRKTFRVGDEVPDKVVKDVDDSLILEKVAKKNPNSLSREQLMAMAGLGGESGEEEEEEFNEEEFRAALSEFDTKAELIEWANEAYGVELDSSDTRAQLEDQIVSFQTSEEEE
jgi:hypothetical protein